MLFGYVFLKKRYTPAQIVRLVNNLLDAFISIVFQISVSLVSVGVILTTLSRPGVSSRRSDDDLKQYIIGISMLTISSLLTGVLGMLQELTYRKHGPCWREGMFYTVSLKLYLTS